MASQQVRFDNGSSPRAVENHNDYDDLKSVPRSFFNLSRLYSTTVDIGALVPVDCIKVVPGDEVELSQDLFVMGLNPLVKRMLNGCTIYTHVYYSRCNDLWKGWNNYLTKGRSGNISKLLPDMQLSDDVYHCQHNTNSGAYTSGYLMPTTPMSLLGYLGVPWSHYCSNIVPTDSHYDSAGYDDLMQTNSFRVDQSFRSFLTEYEYVNVAHERFSFDNGDDVLVKINALPFAMYQRIYRDYYLNKNLSQNNKHWFPDDEDEFILPYEASKVAVLGPNPNGQVEVSPYFVRNGDLEIALSDDTITLPADYPALPFLRYRQRRADDFTTSLPWQQRGDQLNLFGSGDNVWVRPTHSDPNLRFDEVGSSSNGLLWAHDTTNDIATNFVADLSSIALTANRIRELFVLSQWQERSARTNGDYNQMVKANTSVDPNWRDRTPMYLGGTRQNLVFTEVLQTSEDGNTPLGTQAGRAVSAGSSHLCKFRVPDYGYIMKIVSIVPDENYSQGLEKYLFGATSFADEYFPAFQNLAPEPVLNKEVQLVGNPSKDEDVFGWRERYSYMKTRQNLITGNLSLSPALDSDMASYTFSRYFDYTSTSRDSSFGLSNVFVTLAPPTLRRDMFSVPSEPMFLLQVANRVGAVRPLAYQVKPASLNGVAM